MVNLNARMMAWLAMCLFSMSGMVLAETEDAEQSIRRSIAMAVPELKVTAIQLSPVSGLYEVLFEDERPLFVTADGKYLLTGDLYSLQGHQVTNLSETRRESERAGIINAVDEKQLIVYKPEGKIKSVVSIFTDIDCPYCRKMHQQIPRLNELGVQVNYFAYPRAGVGSSSYHKIVSAWCAENPAGAMDDAKAGKVIAKKMCENPVAEHLQIGQKVGVTGTPAIVTEKGKLLPGYMPADALAKEIGVL